MALGVRQCQHPPGMLARVWTAPLLIQFPASGLEEAVEDIQSAWVPATQVGDLDKAPGFQLWLDAELATAVIWGFNL